MKLMHHLLTVVVSIVVSFYFFGCVTNQGSTNSTAGQIKAVDTNTIEQSNAKTSQNTTQAVQPKKIPRGMAEIQSLHTALPSSTVYDKEQVKKAILKSANYYHWTPEQEQGDVLFFRMQRRSHIVKIKVTYSMKEYTIEYVDSENMKYDKENNLIHHNYMRWINNLDKRIQKLIFSKN